MKIETNADHIRSADDEELARMLVKSTYGEGKFCHPGLCEDGETCEECAIRWLDQPYKGEECQNELG